MGRATGAGDQLAGTPLPPRTARGRATRLALLDAARDVFATDGFEGAHILDITRAAGVASGTFYTYFTTKDELFREVAFEVIDELTVAPRHTADRGGRGLDPAADIESAIRAYVEACRRHARIAASIHQLSHVDPVIRDRRSARFQENATRGAAYIRRLQAEGRADPAVDAAATADALQTMIVSVVYEHLVLFETGADPEGLVRTLVGIWVRAIGIPTP